MKKKEILKNFGDRYQVIEHDGGYILYDKERKSNRANALYLGYFFVSTDGKKFSFNGEYYDTVETLIEAMDTYNSMLPFDSEIYNPMYRKHCKIEMALHDYLKSLGFSCDRHKGYCLVDAYGQDICVINFDVKDDTTEGKVSRFISNSDKWTEAEFSDLDSAISAVNSIVVPYCVIVNAVVSGMLKKLTGSRASNICDKTFDFKTLNVYSEDAKEKAIELLENEIKLLKELS